MTNRNAVARKLGGWVILLMMAGSLLQACSDAANPTPALSNPTTQAQNTSTTLPPATNGPQPNATVAVPTSVPATATPLPPTVTPVPKPAEPLYVAIVVDYHQSPLAGSGENSEKPRTLRDYVNLPTQLEKLPSLKLTMSLSGSLLSQLEQSQTTGKDRFSIISEKNAAVLNAEEKAFMLTRFFEVSEGQLVRFPRFLDLKRKRGDKLDQAALNEASTSFTLEDWRDLQVLYNLSQLPTTLQQSDPARSIIAKVVGFSEEDKLSVVALQSKLGREALLEKYQKLQKSAQVEFITAPYAYPIVPLLVNSDAARNLVGAKGTLPTQPYAYPADVSGQLQKSQDLLKARFGASATGLLPPEGAVSAESVSLFQAAGANWIVSDESVLARSLGLASFERTTDGTVTKAGQLYQPYLVDAGSNSSSLAVFFRDRELSNLFSKGYAGKPVEESAEDFVTKLKAVPTQFKKEGLAESEPRIITLVLDGNSMFTGYPNEGENFLTELSKRLDAEKMIKLVTPSEYLKQRPATARFTKLETGSWAGDSLEGWIGQTEKNKAWTYLTQARTTLNPFLKGEKSVEKAKLDKAAEWLYLAQASDILRGFGPNAEEALAADLALRTNLSNAFKELGEPEPDYLKIAITPKIAANPTRVVTDQFNPQINGNVSEQEWAAAGSYVEAPAANNPALTATYFGWDNQKIYLRFDANQTWREIDPQTTVALYLGSPRQKDESKLNFFSRNSATGDKKTALGFGAGYEIQIQVDSRRNFTTALLASSSGQGNWATGQEIEPVFAGSQSIEIALPWKVIPDLEPGDKVFFTAVLVKGTTDLQKVPAAGAGVLEAPDSLGLTQVLTATDPKDDDKGTGDYTYPVGKAYSPGVFDLTNFTVAKDDAKNLVIKLRIAGPLENSLNAPNGFSLQTFDVYIRNPRSTGVASTNLLPGRNARLSSAEAWQYAIVAEGWEPALYQLDRQGKPVKSTTLPKVQADPANRTVTIKVPLSALGSEDPENWLYLAALLGTDTAPTEGVLRVRDVEINATTDKFGGAPDNPASGNHTRIIDTLVPSGQAAQERLLGNFKASQETNPAKLEASSFALLYMLRPRR